MLSEAEPSYQLHLGCCYLRAKCKHDNYFLSSSFKLKLFCLSPIVIWNRLNLVLSFLGSQLHLDCRYLRLLCTFSLVCISSHSIFLVVLLLNWCIINIAVKKFLLSNMYISQNCQWNMYTVKSLFYFKMYSLHCKSTLPAVY